MFYKPHHQFFPKCNFKDYVHDVEESSETFDLAHTLSEAQEVIE